MAAAAGRAPNLPDTAKVLDFRLRTRRTVSCFLYSRIIKPKSFYMIASSCITRKHTRPTRACFQEPVHVFKSGEIVLQYWSRACLKPIDVHPAAISDDLSYSGARWMVKIVIQVQDLLNLVHFGYFSVCHLWRQTQK